MSSLRDLQSLRFLYRNPDLDDDEQDELDREKADQDLDIEKNDLKEEA